MTQVITVRFTSIYRYMFEREGKGADDLYRRLKMRKIAGKFDKQVQRYEKFLELCLVMNVSDAATKAIEATE